MRHGDHQVRRHRFDDDPDVVEITAGRDTLTVELDQAATLAVALQQLLDDTSAGPDESDATPGVDPARPGLQHDRTRSE